MLELCMTRVYPFQRARASAKVPSGREHTCAFSLGVELSTALLIRFSTISSQSLAAFRCHRSELFSSPSQPKRKTEENTFPNFLSGKRILFVVCAVFHIVLLCYDLWWYREVNKRTKKKSNSRIEWNVGRHVKIIEENLEKLYFK